ncbi:hemolysin family protein [Flavicella sediminum]|uniref:hemolysin family protein n=1 Tax=Flavicella sediminum TaxID=2585141 RepID=UPI001122EA28|nr:hemolysin family protein [Flavicella sediminum]
MGVEITIIIVSVLLSAFFSGLEIAFISSNKLHIELEKKGDTIVSKILERITKKSSKFITTMLVGNNISLVVYSYYMGALIVDVLIPFIGIAYFNEFSVLLIQTLISTLIILVTAEFLPKAIFRIYANETLKLFAVPAYFFYILFYYISGFISRISDFFLKVFFNDNGAESQTEFSKEELGDYINEQLDTADDSVDSEIQIFQNALDFHKLKAREIMVPRTEIIAVEIHETTAKLKRIFAETGLSKVVIYKTSLDDILGYVNAFDLFKKPKSIKSILMPVENVPESSSISDVLNSLIKKRKSIAIVLDEYGGTSGLITVEDIIEELFGEIEDEHDSIELLEVIIKENKFQFSSRLEIDYLNETYNLNIPKDEGYETLGGFILNHTEDIPVKGDILTIENYKIEVLKSSTSKIEQVYLTVLEA